MDHVWGDRTHSLVNSLLVTSCYTGGCEEIRQSCLILDEGRRILGFFSNLIVVRSFPQLRRSGRALQPGALRCNVHRTRRLVNFTCLRLEKNAEFEESWRKNFGEEPLRLGFEFLSAPCSYSLSLPSASLRDGTVKLVHFGHRALLAQFVLTAYALCEKCTRPSSRKDHAQITNRKAINESI